MQLGFRVLSFVLREKSPINKGSSGSVPRGVIASVWTFAGTAFAMSIPKHCKALTNASSPSLGVVVCHSNPEPDSGDAGGDGDVDEEGISERPATFHYSLNRLAELLYHLCFTMQPQCKLEQPTATHRLN